MFKSFIKKFINFLNKNSFFEKIFSYIKTIDNFEKVEFNNKNIYLLNVNNITHFRTKTLFSKEPETIEWINNFNEGDKFWDIGANIGIYSIYSQFIEKNIETLAFEPSVFNLEVLVKNINKNNLENKISIITNPLYSISCIDKFNISTVQKGGANSNFSDVDFNRVAQAFYKTNSINFKLLFNEYNLVSPDKLKIDVDGNELDILKSLFNTENKVKSILLEINTNKNELEDLLKSNNFKNVFKSNQRNNQIWEKS